MTNHFRLSRIGAALFALWLSILVAGCGAVAPQATPLPTRTPLPTFTPTPEEGVIAQPPAPEQSSGQEQTQPSAQEGEATAPEQPSSPTDTPTPEPTPTPQVAQLVLNDNVNIRSGPGTNYNLLGTERPGSTYRVTGRSPDGAWWRIDYNGREGWVFGQLVTVTGAESVAVAQNIPPTPIPPTPTNTPVPAPAPAEPQQPPPAEPQQPAPPSGNNYPFILGNTERCDPNPGQTYFSGYVRDTNNNPVNGVCVHIWFYEPRTTKCSGCDGVGDGVWGFSPFGGPAPRGTTVEIFVVQCPSGPLPPGGLSSNFGDLTPQSPKWVRTINESEQCTGITFYRR
ncbi:MAG: SH3 domain-containing protein [Caldilinea sp.]|nr:SH3 domain-containing protein [Caldilinea sp.]MDW8441674.1 SH3 domain-containing protein [Caldilineaceae bacterium]